MSGGLLCAEAYGCLALAAGLAPPRSGPTAGFPTSDRLAIPMLETVRHTNGAIKRPASNASPASPSLPVLELSLLEIYSMLVLE